MGALVRVALTCVAALALALMQSRGCGYTPEPLKGEGEPCTRTDECQSHLTCSGGVCRELGLDAGPGFDAGGPDTGVDEDAGAQDAGGSEAGVDAGGAPDAAVSEPDAASPSPDAG